MDSTSASGYGHVSGEGLCQYGHSRDHRPDISQVKIELTVLDPLSLPLVTQVVHGNSSDDPLYAPGIRQAQTRLSERGLTHIGGSRMGAFDIQAYTQHSGDCCLMPLNLVPMSAEAIEARLAPGRRGLWKQGGATGGRKEEFGGEERCRRGHRSPTSARRF